MTERIDRDRDLTDPSNYRRKLQGQLELVQDELETERDADAIIRWVNGMRDKAETTVAGRINCVRKLSERADKPLVEFSGEDEVYELLASFADGSHPDVKDDGLSEGTLRQYRQAARLFFRDQLGHEWGEEIKIGQPEASSVTPEQILTSDEVDALLEACESPRDSAMISFLIVTGQRVTATLSIRVGDVEMGQRTAKVRLNDDAIGLKGASGPRPLLWSRPYIASWLENHPRRHDDDAPLFCTVQGGQRPTEEGDIITWDAGAPLSRQQAQNRIREVAADADVPAGKVKLHNFRHTAITRMRNEGVEDDRIRFMVGVEPGSAILERYDQADNETMMQRIREHHGVVDESVEVGRPTTAQCHNCSAQVRASARFCPSCGSPRDVAAAESLDEQQAGLIDDLDSNDPRDRKLAREAMENLMNDPEFKELLVEQFLADHGSSP